MQLAVVCSELPAASRRDHGSGLCFRRTGRLEAHGLPVVNSTGRDILRQAAAGITEEIPGESRPSGICRHPMIRTCSALL